MIESKQREEEAEVTAQNTRSRCQGAGEAARKGRRTGRQAQGEGSRRKAAQGRSPGEIPTADAHGHHHDDDPEARAEAEAEAVDQRSPHDHLAGGVQLMKRAVHRPRRNRPLLALLACAPLALSTAGCGVGGGGGGGAKGVKAEPETVQTTGAGSPAAQRKAIEAASLKREDAELAAQRRRREAEARLRASSVVAAPKAKHAAAHHHKARAEREVEEEGETIAELDPDAGAGGETAAQRAARKRFEAEEAREAAVYGQSK